ncbi:MAG: hypothetical protein JJT76_06890 [Clostridiaceae bacterium]|nr:hypothetical protein [Clostridiaceae bacterium]
MNRKQKSRLLVTLLLICLIGAVPLIQGMQGMVNAAGEVTVTVSNLSQLYSAMIQAKDGDVIGINGVINIFSTITIGDNDKHIILKRMNETSYINMDGVNSVVQNITFDGGEINSPDAFVLIYTNSSFQNVNFKNSFSNSQGGAVKVIGGTVSFDNCVFDNNKAVQGGHIYVNQMANVTIENSILQNGYATKDGGAIRNSVSPTTCNILYSTITGNSAGEFGGGISNYGFMKVTESKVYDNAATYGGADIANAAYGNLNLLESSLEILTELFKDDGIVPIDWVNDYDFESEVELHDINPEMNNSLLKLIYEIPPTEVVLAPESLGIEDDGKIRGLESGKHYKVTVDDVISYSKTDGSLTTNESEAEALTGTEIIGLTNGLTYLVEEYTPPVEEEEEEEPPADEEEPQDPIDEEPPVEEPGEEDETPGDEEQEDNDQEEQEQEEEQDTDQEEQEQTQTPSESNVDQVSSQEQTSTSTSNSSSRSTTDIAEINPSSSSVVNNYFYGDDRSTSNQNTNQADNQNPSNGQVASVSPNNIPIPISQEQTIKIDAASIVPDGVKVQEDGDGLTINVNVNVGSDVNGTNDRGSNEPLQTQSETNLTWIELVKICLLFGIFICVFRRPMSN